MRPSIGQNGRVSQCSNCDVRFVRIRILQRLGAGRETLYRSIVTDQSRIQQILEFWFGELDANGHAAPEQTKIWFSKDVELDARMRERFGADVERAARGELDGWKQDPRGRLALIILLDQFSRNIYRGTAGAFGNDARALELALEGLRNGEERQLRDAERHFLLMPLMHSENLDAQNLCVDTFRRMEAEQREAVKGGLRYAELHRDIVARFGRFPHRNALLGRASTPEEIECLKQPNSSF